LNKEDEVRKLEDFLDSDDLAVCNQLIPKFKLPDQLRQFNNLPPSLVPPNLNDFLNSSSNIWG
jgi:hypothetical protein